MRCVSLFYHIEHDSTACPILSLKQAGPHQSAKRMGAGIHLVDECGGLVGMDQV